MSEQNGNSGQVWVWEDVNPVQAYQRTLGTVAWAPPPPEPPAGVLDEVMALEAGGRLREALALLKAALASDGQRAALHAAAGHIQAKLGLFDEAAESYRRLHGIEPQNAAAVLDLAVCLAMLGRWREALLKFEESAAPAGEFSSIARFGLGVCRIALHDPEAALAYLEEGLDSPECGEGCLLGKGIALHLMGRLDEAADVYRQVLRRSPHSPDAIANLALIEDGQPDAGILSELLETHPDLREALEGLAAVSFASGDYKSASRYCERLIQVAPSYEAWFNLGVAYEEMGRPKDAGRAYRTAIDIRPDCEEALVNLGALCYGTGDIRGAQAAFKQALENGNSGYLVDLQNLDDSNGNHPGNGSGSPPAKSRN